jgi:hypothetical protein
VVTLEAVAKLKDVLTQGDAQLVYSAAFGAARHAEESGDAELSEALMGMTRSYRSVGRYGRPGAVTPVPEDSTLVKADTLPDIFTAVGRAVLRAGAFGADGAALLGPVAHEDGARLLWVKRHGASVRYVAGAVPEGE